MYVQLGPNSLDAGWVLRSACARPHPRQAKLDALKVGIEGSTAMKKLQQALDKPPTKKAKVEDLVLDPELLSTRTDDLHHFGLDASMPSIFANPSVD